MSEQGIETGEGRGITTEQVATELTTAEMLLRNEREQKEEWGLTTEK